MAKKKTEEKVKIPGLKTLAQEAPLEVYPQLFNVIGVSKTGSKIMLYTKAHYSAKEAIEAFRINVPIKTGIPGHLWEIKITTSISAEDLEKEFTEIRDQVQLEKKQSKNRLMKQILDEKNIDLLQRHYDRFTNNEIVYMHEELTKNSHAN